MNAINLDLPELYSKLDTQNMRSSIVELPLQLKQTWDEIQSMDINPELSHVKNIVFSGMGGSALGAYVLKYLYGNKLTVPFEIVNDYNLPAYVSSDTLVIVQTYSGTTEETLSCFNQAREKGAKIYAVSAGGTLEQEARASRSFFYKIDPKHNPSNQPRMAIGYSIFALIAFLDKLNMIKIDASVLDDVYKTLDENNRNYGINAPTNNNAIKQLAWNTHERLPLFIAAEHLIGSVHATRNQLNENAKSLAVYFPLPECDHHLLEGLIYPHSLDSNDIYIFLNSSDYSEKLKLRLTATEMTMKSLQHETYIIDVPGKHKLTQTVAAIHIGSYLGFYLAMLNGIDPSPIPQVEGFKKRISHA